MTIKRLILISRPIAYIPFLFIYIAGAVYANPQNWYLVVFYACFSVLLQSLVMNGLNDIYDIESDSINERKGGVYGARLKNTEKPSLLRYIYIASIFSFLPAALLGSYGLLISSGAILLLAYAYSVPPIRLKSRPVFDSFTNGFGALLVFMSGFWVAGGNTGYPKPGLILCIFIFAFVVHALGAYMDYESDKKTNDKTIAVFLGKKVTLLLCLVLMSLSALLLYLSFTPSIKLFVTILYLMCFAFVCTFSALVYPQKLKHIIVIMAYFFPLVIAVNIYYKFFA